MAGSVQTSLVKMKALMIPPVIIMVKNRCEAVIEIAQD